MNNYTLTYEDALKLVEKYDDFNYSSKTHNIDGYKIVTFTYFLCDYNTFTKPIINSNINGLDMRGSTFVFNKDGTLWKKFLMISKFFNLNQVESTQYDLIKDKKIKSINEKADGSLIAFMNLPNGEVFAKTIGGFDNDQVFAAMKLYNNDPELRDFIEGMLETNHTPLFEYVSPANRIVLKYNKSELKLLGIRNNISGIYTPSSGIKTEFDITKVDNHVKLSLRKLIHMSEFKEDIEGWVIEFEDGQLIKIKTDWYFNRHGLRTQNIFREDYVIRNYLEETLDDLLSQLDPTEDSDAYKFVDKSSSAVSNYIRHIDKEVNILFNIFNNVYDGNWTKFATDKHTERYFGLIKSKIISVDHYNEHKVKYILNKTKKLELARAFVDEWTDLKDEIISKWKGN